MTLIPTVYNADTLGIRPDLIKRPIDSWAELLDPEFKGKAAILNVPAIGIMDAAMVVQGAGLIKYGDKGNMTKPEIDKTIDNPDRDEEGRPVPRHLEGRSTSSVNLMASGEVVIQSMWSPAVDRGALSMGIPCNYQPLKEGYRAWGTGIGLPKPPHRQEARCRLRVHQLVHVGLGRRVPQPPRLLPAVLDTAKKYMTADEWGYWMEGKPAKERHRVAHRRTDGKGRHGPRRRLV